MSPSTGVRPPRASRAAPSLWPRPDLPQQVHPRMPSGALPWRAGRDLPARSLWLELRTSLAVLHGGPQTSQQRDVQPDQRQEPAAESSLTGPLPSLQPPEMSPADTLGASGPERGRLIIRESSPPLSSMQEWGQGGHVTGTTTTGSPHPRWSLWGPSGVQPGPLKGHLTPAKRPAGQRDLTRATHNHWLASWVPQCVVMSWPLGGLGAGLLSSHIPSVPTPSPQDTARGHAASWA